MANINVTYGDLQDAAAKLSAGEQDLIGKLNELKAYIESLVGGGFVTDQASGAFRQKYEEFTTGTTQVVSGLDGLSGFLTQTAQIMQDTDSTLASTIRG